MITRVALKNDVIKITKPYEESLSGISVLVDKLVMITKVEFAVLQKIT